MQFQYTEQEIYLRKIMRRRDEIGKHLFSNVRTVENISYWETREHKSFDEAINSNKYRPIRVGDSWGGGMNAWFKFTVNIPTEFKGKEVCLFFDINGEACAFIDGKPFCGFDKHHKEVLLANNAVGGEKFEFMVDAISGASWAPDKATRDPEYKNLPSIVARCEIATRNVKLTQYWYNLDLLYKLAEQLPSESPRRAKIIYTLNKSVDAFDYTHTDESSLEKSAIKANKILEPLLECKANESDINLAVIGHSHIDVAWKWPYSETKRKCSRTFSTVIRLMEQYPEYLYTQGQAILYEYTKEKYPSLYEDIKKRVNEGRWDVTGSMYVEADCNLCSGESLIRQILIGKNFFKDEFGIETDVLWLPDVFGYSAALPQILKKSRVNYFFTNKIHWSDINKPPYGTFWWKGIDGTKVLAHFPPSSSYNSFPDPSWMLRYQRNWQDKDRAGDVLFTYGWGDGGGGPESKHLEYLRRSNDLEGLPRCTHTKVTDFFKKIDNGTDYHEWVGELYLEYHRGTYTTQAKNKKNNRKSEFLYRDAEFLSAINETIGVKYPQDKLQDGWKKILAMQFHDVIPGTSIRQVYEETDRLYEEVFNIGENIIDQSIANLTDKMDTSGEGDAIIIFNTLPWNRSDRVIVNIDNSDDYTVLDPDGSEVDCEYYKDSLAFMSSVPSMGYSVYRLVKRKRNKLSNEILVSNTKLENKYYKIILDGKGLISSIIHKETGREVIPQGKRANLFQLFEDKPLTWQAWDIEFFADEKYEDITDLQSINVIRTGPVSGGLEICRKFGNSTLKQKIVIYADIPRIDFCTLVDWQENNKLLRVVFPVDVNSDKARYEIQFGNVERNTHKNTSWDFAKFEVCAHKWIDLSDGGFGVSLMNDCKYGHSVNGNTMRLTLLKAPSNPDPLADRGEHTFTYSLMPHKGDYIDAQTVRRSYELNVPLIAKISKPSSGMLPKTKSFISTDSDNVVIETVKKAEKENALIIRLFECHNKRSAVNVKIDLPFNKVYECDLLEDNICELSMQNNEFSFEIKPFEIKTFKLEK